PRPLCEPVARPGPFDPSAPRRMQPIGPDDWDHIAWRSGGGKLVLSGNDTGATFLAVSRFLEEEGGVRWWVPGPVGEDVPARRDWQLPSSFRSEKPSFISRGMFRPGGKGGYTWARRNMLREHIQMGHNLQTIFTPEVARAHPEWFPKFGGRAFDVDSWKGPIPHPLFTSAEAADYAADKILEYFRTHPGEATCSISPYDSSLFGDDGQYPDLVPESAIFRGKTDYSNAVFFFDNVIARRVAAEFPERRLGALAYAFWENAPSFPVERNLIPYLTADRGEWFDPAFRAEDLDLIRRWAAAGPEIVGTWDYLYGSPYFVPRVLLDITKESLPAIHEAGVRAYYVQLDPLSGFDAPKTWILTQLLWDVTQDPDRLEAEFFDGYFGPAADSIHRFYEKCDEIWMRQPGHAFWIKYYGNTDQAAIYSPEDLRRLRAIIDETLALPLEGKYRTRVELVSSAFSVTERFHAAWEAGRTLSAWNPGMPGERLVEAVRSFMPARRDMFALNDSIRRGTDPNFTYEPMGFLVDDDPLPGRLAYALRELGAGEIAAIAALAPEEFPAAPGRRIFPLYSNPFEAGLKNWLASGWPDPTMQYGVSGPKGAECLRVDRALTLCFTLSARIKAGTAYSAALSASGKLSPGATVRFLLEYLDADDKRLGFHSDRLPCGTLDRQLLCVAGTAPAGSVRARLTLTILYMQEEGDSVTFSAWTNAR
ncbi:MAG TPA: DUF4838 domain-containing protein, partial [Opitutales bacterium]|nr:DUF4838 domain-containing protein [Opitutales bacterium]